MVNNIDKRKRRIFQNIVLKKIFNMRNIEYVRDKITRYERQAIENTLLAEIVESLTEGKNNKEVYAVFDVLETLLSTEVIYNNAIARKGARKGR